MQMLVTDRPVWVSSRHICFGNLLSHTWKTRTILTQKKKFFGMLRAQQQNEIFHTELCAEDQHWLILLQLTSHLCLINVNRKFRVRRLCCCYHGPSTSWDLGYLSKPLGHTAAFLTQLIFKVIHGRIKEIA